MRRAVRRGRVDLDDFLDPYAALRPGSHALLEDARRLDLAAVVAAFVALPRSLLSAPRLMAVPRLEGFTRTPIAGAGPRAALAADGTLLLETGLGQVSLVALIGALCALAWEQAKARRLLAGRVAEPEMTSLAMDLGVEEALLRAAGDATGLAIFDLLRGVALPELRVHADCGEAATRERAEHSGRRVLAALAEMGLIERPIFLFIGSDLVTGILSPYARELRGPLLTWAAQKQPALGADLRDLSEPVGEDALYALAYDFVASDPTLAAERAQADRTVGILRYEGDGLPFELVDLGRIEPEGCDARLAGLAAPTPAPVLVRLAYNLEDTDATLLRTLLEALGRRVIGAALVMEGVALAGSPGSIVLPHLLVQWDESKLWLPGAMPFVAAELLGYADVQVLDGAVLSTAAPSLLAPAHVSELVRAYGVAAVEVGGAAALHALMDARLRGVLSPEASLSWALVAGQTTMSGRPSLGATAGHSAVALAVLHHLTGARPARVDPPSPKRRASSRSLRIKA